MLTYSLRVATPRDHGPLQEIGRAAWHKAYAHIYTPQQIDDVFEGRIRQRASWIVRRQIRLNNHVAELDGRVCGFIGLALLDDPEEGEVTSLYVLPDFQAQGLGSALWHYGLGILHKNHQRRHVYVWTLARAEAVGFYERLGCTEVERGQYSLADRHEEAIGFRISLD